MNHRPQPSRRLLLALSITALLGGCGGERPAADRRPRLAFVTNGVDPFWTIAAAGVAAGNAEFDADCDVRMPKDVVDQKGILEDLLAKGIQGIAISPIDAANQVSLLNEAARHTPLITADSDAPGSDRLCFIGVDNYEAGRLAGQLVKEALPEGGTVMIFVGRLEQDNARQRRQGVIDELLDRERDPTRNDPTSRRVGNERYSVLDTRTDQFDYAKAKSNAEDALARHPDLGCMVGLFAYNTPNLLEALSGAGRLGEVAVVGFDEQAPTLQGVLDGHVHGTVVQDPFEYGRQSVRILAALARGEEHVLPQDGYLEIPARIVRREDCQVFWDRLKERLAGGGSDR